MLEDLGFLLLLLSNGILVGLMYALIALGFVLVYKATDAVNFAQGEFVMIAGLVVAASLIVWGAPIWLAVALGVGGMVGFGFTLERVMLRKLIGRPVIAVVMATIQLVDGLVRLNFLTGFGWFFLKSRKGIAIRAVADNQQVAMAVGIDVERY